MDKSRIGKDIVVGADDSPAFKDPNNPTSTLQRYDKETNISVKFNTNSTLVAVRANVTGVIKAVLYVNGVKKEEVDVTNPLLEITLDSPESEVKRVDLVLIKANDTDKITVQGVELLICYEEKSTTSIPTTSVPSTSTPSSTVSPTTTSVTTTALTGTTTVTTTAPRPTTTVTTMTPSTSTLTSLSSTASTVSTTISITLTTSTPSNKCDMSSIFNNTTIGIPIGIVQRPTEGGENGFSNTTFYTGDTLEEGDRLITDCYECICTDGQLKVTNNTCDTCTTTEWGSWEMCTKDCDTGSRTRYREVLSDNKLCSLSDTKETEDCNTHPCLTTTPVCGPWSEWLACTNKPCETMQQKRFRNCGGQQESQDQICPMNCTSTPVCTDGMVYSECVQCPLTCQSYREDTCQQQDTCEAGCTCPEGMVLDSNHKCINKTECPCYINGQELYPGIPINTTACNTCTCNSNRTVECTNLPDCCTWSAWSNWGTCNKTCEKTRYRQLESGIDCGSNVEVKQCSADECKYYCVDENNNDTMVMVGDKMITNNTCEYCVCDDIDSKKCYNDSSRIVDGNWSEWSLWQDCTKTCTGGIRRRHRECSSPPPACGGSPCDGNSTDQEYCNSGFSCCIPEPWSDWSDCGDKCGNVTVYRSRNYKEEDVPICPDIEKTENKTCQNDPCNVTCPEWSSWTPCSTTCGTGTTSRVRETEDPNCTKKEDKRCSDQDCPCEDENKIWSDKVACQKTCKTQYFPESECKETTEGCMCKEGLIFYNGTCLNTTETPCPCEDDQGNVYPHGTFDSKTNKCELCECKDGQLECFPKFPTDITCKPGEIMVEDEQCTKTCKPDDRKTTCKLTRAKHYITADNCTSTQPVEYIYCSGHCKESTYAPRVISDNLVSNSTYEKDCACCTGLPGDFVVFDMKCINSAGTIQAKVQSVKSCMCDTCVKTEANKRIDEAAADLQNVRRRRR